ncbi:glycosyltransferase family 39 protein [Isosphaeraceae bacterium EP7]
MPEARLGLSRGALVVAMAALTLLPGLGSSARLTYHEAFVAQPAREMIDGGGLLVPRVNGQPWLEKPPLPTWLVAASGLIAGGVNAAVARFPSALASMAVSLGVATLAARRFGGPVGLLAGLVQATTAWAVTRGRLAEADIHLAALITWTIVAFDRLRQDSLLRTLVDDPGPVPAGNRAWRWALFGLLGTLSLAKGIGFGAVLVAAATVPVLLWDRDMPTFRALRWRKGWMLAAALALTWPALVIARHPSVLGLWTLHVSDRFAANPEHFAGGSRLTYPLAVLGQTLPWTPWAIAGAWTSWRRAWPARGRGGIDRLLWAWAAAPLALLSMATVKNGHYAIHALPPFAIWSALGLVHWSHRLAIRGYSPVRCARVAFTLLGFGFALGYPLLGPLLDRRGSEWAYYEEAAAALEAGEPLALLYDDWDRTPYPTPFGPVPHDLAIRLFSFARPATWHQGIESLAAASSTQAGPPFAVLARSRDLPDLARLGRVETLSQGPILRASSSSVDDRAFILYRITPETVAAVPGPDRR